MTIQKRQSIIIIAVIAATISIIVAAYDDTSSDKITLTEKSNYIDYSEQESIVRTEVSKVIKNYEKYGKAYFDTINAVNIAATPGSTEYYPFAIENESFIILAHGADITKIGTVADAMFSADKPITQIQDELETVGFTWITYHWENPRNGILQEKTSYLVLQGDNTILGAGYYHHEYDDKGLKTIQNVEELKSNYAKFGKAHFDTINAMNTIEDQTSTEYYPFVMDSKTFVFLAHGADKTNVGKVASLMFDATVSNEDIVKELNENGSTWIHYSWVNPENGEIQEKTTYLVLQNDVILASGYYLD